ncbi:hypothetical protein LXM94_11525 [Rhizobium sp. TRM95111]|uniref:hypothetical protein n=1 Tax=Rhizobium alarense TaxID=2846851 RepID=UPI001F326E00|nr:hypothetical protein [Rhizobium alarense]MCF3640594.1 hypothetical protein [Rhizobium alarense]
MSVPNIIELPCETEETDRLKEIAAIARMISLARQQANDTGEEFLTYCLDMSLAAAMQILELGGETVSPLDRATWSGPRALMN